MNFNNISKHEDLDETYSNFENSITKTLDKHASIKRRKQISQPAPFMNKHLRHAIYKKRMLHNTFIKCKNDYNWERYRKQRNHVNKIKDSNITPFFRFVNKRASYPFGIISFAHVAVNVTDFSIGSINCVRHFPQT